MSASVTQSLSVGPPDPASPGDEAIVEHITGVLRHQVTRALRRRGLVVAVSGGVDSSLCLALAARAMGPERVLALAMPEAESDPDSLALARECAARFGVELQVEDISGTLTAVGCYARRDAAVRSVLPDYGPGWEMKVTLPGLDHDRLNVPRLSVRSPAGEVSTVRIPASVYTAVVAATNFKQRVRAMLAYHHADRLHYAVTGTPNRLEYDQGFFVKGGDGLADVKPIAHLYKSAVWRLARHLGVPEGIVTREPTTDTYSMEQTQEEFYFALPTATVDALLQSLDEGLDERQAAERCGVDAVTAQRAFADLARKRETIAYLHRPPLLVEEVRTLASADQELA